MTYQDCMDCGVNGGGRGGSRDLEVYDFILKPAYTYCQLHAPNRVKVLETSVPFSKPPNAFFQIPSRLKLRVGRRLHCDVGQSMANQSAEMLLIAVARLACLLRQDKGRERDKSLSHDRP